MNASKQDLVKAVKSVFSSPDGRIVWDYLKRTYYDNSMHDDSMTELMRKLGQREVVWTLKKLLGESDD